MADMSKGIGDFPLKDGNRTMTKPLRKNLFNEPMSVRGIKRIELEEMEKNRNQEAMGKVDDLGDLNDAGDYDDQNQYSNLVTPDNAGGALKQHKLTLTNIVEEEISPTSKSSASVLGKQKVTSMGQSTQLVFDGSAEQKFDFKQEIGVADDKEHLEEEEALHSGSVERFLLNRSARTKDNEEKPE